MQIASIGATAVKGITGHEDGLYPNYLDVTRTDGKRFHARNMGRAGTRIVSEPSYFSDNGGYLAAENGTEMIIDNAVFNRLNPEVIDHIMQVKHNVRGFESGMYPAAPAGANTVTSDPELKAMIAAMLGRLSEPIKAYTVFGYDEEESRQKIQSDIEKSKNNGKITS